ncbi:MAG: mannose-1-phosphate guanylyltransferase [Eubacteriales bacterium]|nr:mannose-1-phosphate guanylyltransferase [Eubacteriales bacterium]
MIVCPVILAGGAGTRFWPLSRRDSPKQVLNLSGNDTLIGEAVARFARVAPEENIRILTTEQNMDLVKTALGPTSRVRYIAEPIARGTSACILLAALKLYKEHGECVLCVSPSDHYITKNEEFTATMHKAIGCARQLDAIVTVGIKPTFASTGYGYIGCDDACIHEGAYAVTEFTEKPALQKAKEYLSRGNFLWNSGIFIFRASVIIASFQRFLPRIYNSLMKCETFLNTPGEEEHVGAIYPALQNISIDYGIIERSSDVYVVPADMGWNDIGSWDSLGCIFPMDAQGNIVRADTVSIDTKNCVIYSDQSLVATIGIENLIVVSCGNALLICPKNQDQRVREVVERLQKENLQQYL